MSQQSTTEMGWCRVVGPRGLCRPLNKQPGPRALSGLLGVLTGQDRAGGRGEGAGGRGHGAGSRGQGAGGQGAGAGGRGQGGREQGAGGRGQGGQGGCVPSTVLSGWGPPSEPRAPTQMVRGMGQSHPSHPNYSQFGFRVHPPNPPQGGLSCSLLPFAVQYISDQISQQSTTEMDWCRVVGPRGLSRPLDQKQVSNKQRVKWSAALSAV